MAIESAPPKGADLFTRGAPPNSVFPTAGFGLTLDHNGRLPNAQVLAPDPVANKYLKTDGSGVLSWDEIGVEDVGRTNLTTYTPTWSASGTQPAIGNGTISGKYSLLGKFVIGRTTITMGSSTTFGTGRWSITLPVAAATATVSFFVRYRDNTVGEFTGVAAATSTTVVTLFANAGAAVTTDVTSTVPFTWTTDDVVDLPFWYEAA